MIQQNKTFQRLLADIAAGRAWLCAAVTEADLLRPHDAPAPSPVPSIAVVETPVVTSPRGGGSAVATSADSASVAGCPFQVPAGPGTKPQPCVRVKWLVASTRVKAGGEAVLLVDSTGLCLSGEQIPQGKARSVKTQTRVRAR